MTPLPRIVIEGEKPLSRVSFKQRKKESQEAVTIGKVTMPKGYLLVNFLIPSWGKLQGVGL